MVYLNKSSDRIKVVDVRDDLADVVVVTFDENSGVGLVESHPSSQHRHQVLVRHLHDLDELGEDRMLADGDDRDHRPDVRNSLSRWDATWWPETFNKLNSGSKISNNSFLVHKRSVPCLKVSFAKPKPY